MKITREVKMSAEEPGGKESSGCLQSPTLLSPRTFHQTAAGSKDNLSKVRKPRMSTGRSFAPSLRKSPSSRSRSVSAQTDTSSLVDPMLQAPMFGKTPPLSLAPDLNLDRNQLTPPPKLTGKLFGHLQKPEIWKQSRPMLEYFVTDLCEESMRTIRDQLVWSEVVAYSGVELGLVSRGQLGNKPVWTLILKVPKY